VSHSPAERIDFVRRRAKEPPEPVERFDTVRRYMMFLLEEYTLSAKDLSVYLRISEKDVYDHLEHIRRTMNKGGRHLVVTPARCEKCGFVFSKRGRLSKPGKCPICRSGLIVRPFFSVNFL
jgi:transcriptional regulator